MKSLHIIGQPGAGKTRLMVDLIRELTRQGVRVGSIKHTAHTYELDKPGKDSYLHREAGACAAAMVTGGMAAIYLPARPDAPGINPRTVLENPSFQGLDIILIEGWIRGPYPKIEVWRKETGRDPLFPDVTGVTALVSDDSLGPELGSLADERNLLRFRREKIQELVNYLLQ